MSFTIKEIIKSPEIREPKKEGSLFKKKRVVAINSDEVALICEGDRLYDHVPPTQQPTPLEVGKDAVVLIIPRVMQLDLECSGLTVIQGYACSVVIRGMFQYKASSQGRVHPLVRLLPKELTSEAFSKILATVLSSALWSALSETINQFEYDPSASPSQVDQHLNSIIENQVMRNRLEQIACLTISQPLETIFLSVPEIDEELRQRNEDQKAARQKAGETAVVLDGMGNDATIDTAIFRIKMQQQDRDNIKAITKLKYDLKKEELEAERRIIRNRSEIQQELECEALRLQKAKADKAEAEAREAAACLEKLEQELRDAEEGEDKLKVIGDRLSAVIRELEGMETKTVHEAQNDTKLGLLANWQVYDNSGLLEPNLAATSTLPTGTMLQVAVTVDQDAYVYILLRESRDKWQVVVPDMDGLMGIERNNRQRAHETVIWPGVNAERPEQPFWFLDTHPGTERIMVVASLQQLDIMSYLNEADLKALREKAAPVGVRGFTNKPTNGSGFIGSDYHQAVVGFIGNGCVLQETVITHT